MRLGFPDKQSERSWELCKTPRNIIETLKSKQFLGTTLRFIFTSSMLISMAIQSNSQLESSRSFQCFLVLGIDEVNRPIIEQQVISCCLHHKAISKHSKLPSRKGAKCRFKSTLDDAR